MIYVYDLPAMFNTDLQHKCNDLDPWASKCKANLNSGFGPPAKELAGIVPENIFTGVPESATAFYIPFYVGLAVGNYLWGNHTAKERDWHCEMMLKWVQNQKWWKRSNGADHMLMLMLGRLTWDFRRLTDADDDWGTKFLQMPAMKNVIRLCVERSTWDPLEVAVPYPTIFHPRTKSDIREWQTFVRRRRRTSLFAFVGGRREKIKNDFRGVLQDQCTAAPDACRHVDCARKSCLDGTTAIMESFLDSDFCLQPRGDGFTRRTSGSCLPEPGRYSVFIHRDDVRNGTSIREVLEGYGREEVAMMREKVVEYIPKFVYAAPSEGLGDIRDAFEIGVNGVLRKFKDHMKRGRLGKRNYVWNSRKM
ncbi:glycosyltransferase 18 [Actinidia rufa]|uniref:Glycosyltransferase 18 n=1 Tax=Actinidia rufa TaxID=165716 RepID=A0A7J0H6Q9_9ERIC|nr:glycosyltransferase 18 [Actinidia rufa]